MSESQRNLLILVAIAVVGVVASTAFSISAFAISTLLRIAFDVMIVCALVMLYRRNAGAIARLPLMPRLVLQVAVAIAGIVVVTGTFQFAGVMPYPFGWANGRPVPFYASLFACGFAIWWAWQQRVSRW